MATPTTLPATFVAGNVLQAAQLNDLRGAFRILQVVQTTKTDTFQTTSTSYADVTGLSVSITPSATSSKILVIADVKMSSNADGRTVAIQLVRDSTAIYIGDASGSRRRASAASNGDSSQPTFPATAIFLDSPNTTSATTYKIQATINSGTASINRSDFDVDSTAVGRSASSITVMEISA
jgi:hypothetical protein